MRRRILTLALAGALALVGAIAVFAYANGADRRAVAGQQTVTVLIATKRIPAGTTAAAAASGYVRTDHLPASATPRNAVASLTDAASAQVVLADIQPGQVIISDMFGASRAPTTSGLSIPAGMMAVTVLLPVNADVAGYVQPGSEIAVFDTFVLLPNGTTGGGDGSSASGTDPDQATRLLLARVPVLAVSQGAPTTKNSSAVGGATTMTQTNLMVTVAVNQTDAQKLIHVAQTGKPYAALLTADSRTSTDNGGVDNHGRLGPVFGLKGTS